ncbi:MAG: hypothetical protein R6V58_03000 [Planctomycetota bacterium]
MPELYDLTSDFAERSSLARSEPDVAARLRERLRRRRDRMTTRRALRVAPKSRGKRVRTVLGDLLRSDGQPAQALAIWREGLGERPGDTVLMQRIAWCLATSADPTARDGRQAVTLARQICEATALRRIHSTRIRPRLLWRAGGRFRYDTDRH